MAATLVTLAPSVHAAGTTTSSTFTMPSTTDNEIVVLFTVQTPDISDSTKSLSCQLIDVTAGNVEVAGITGWVGGTLNKAGQPAPPAFGVTGLQDLVGHSLEFQLTLGASLNTGVTITTA